MENGSSGLSPEWRKAVEATEVAPSVSVQDLSEGTLLGVTTDEGSYLFRVLEPAHLRVEVIHGDEDLRPGMVGHLLGSSLVFGGTIRAGWVAVGYGIEFGSEEFAFLPAFVGLATTRDVRVHGASIVVASDAPFN